MPPKKKKYSLPFLMIGAILTLAAAYYCAAGMHPGETVFQWRVHMETVLKNPAAMYWNQYTLKTMAILLLIYILAGMMYVTGKRNYLPGREMGSAQYADIKKVNRRLADLSKDPDDPQNIAVFRKRKRRRWRA